jgi:hypothetical protein
MTASVPLPSVLLISFHAFIEGSTMQHARTGLVGAALIALALLTSFALPATVRETTTIDTARQPITVAFSNPAAAK